MVGAESVVAHDISGGTVVAGKPVKVRGAIKAFPDKRKLEMEREPRFGVPIRFEVEFPIK